MSSPLGRPPRTGKSFRVVRACVRAACMPGQIQGKKVFGVFPFSLFGSRSLPFSLFAPRSLPFSLASETSETK